MTHPGDEPMSAPLPSLPRRDPIGHKGTFGVVIVIGGQAGPTPMVGSPALSAIAALRSGAGLAKLAMPDPVVLVGLTVAPSATGVSIPVDDADEIISHEAVELLDSLLTNCDCLAIGPGLGTSAGAMALTLRAIGQTTVPVVVDADALNNLAATPQLQLDFHARAILTPHPGEFARLAKSLGIAVDIADASKRETGAEQLAQRLGCVVVLKGAATVVSDGQRTWVNDTADSALATAGTGDVLTGVIAGFVAQFASSTGASNIKGSQSLDLFDCARLGVRVHALAAAVWRNQSGAGAGLLASELADCLPGAIEPLRTGA